MKEIGKILLYLAATVFLGALLAPLLFWGAHALARGLANARLSAFFAETDFQRFFNRAMLVAAVALLWPLARALRIRNFHESLGLARERRPWRRFFAGFGMAAGTLLVLGAWAILADVYNFKTEIPWGRIAWLPFPALAVALIEEALFRGALQGVVRRTATDGAALVFVAALFALIHFLKPPEDAVAPHAVAWWSGFALVPRVFWQWGDLKLLLGGFSTIFLVGLILGFARMRTRSLWMPVGLHAGWIFWKMSFSKMSKRGAEDWPWFGRDMLIGLAPVLALLLTWAVVWFWLRNEKRH